MQDFEFPEASNKIKTTRDGQYCLATGTYKPRVKIYDLLELSLKSERVTDSENVDFCILSDDWTKTLHLQADRSVSVHTAASAFYSTRIPTHGRALEYHFPSCDAIIGAQGNQVYRLNLDQGRFLLPLECEATVSGVNALDVNPAHGLLSIGTESDDGIGSVEFWDLRSRMRAGVLQLPSNQLLGGATSFDGISNFASPPSVTSLASRFDGLSLAVGTSTGHTLLYDLRSPTPYTVKDQGYGLPVKSIQWINSSASSSELSDEAGGLIATVDSKVLKIWGAQSTQNLISINPPNNINDLHVYPDTGLVFLANEAGPITSYYIPQLGNAPKWARFLDNMTEEMEQDSVETLYDDYKFVDRQELKRCAWLLHCCGVWLMPVLSLGMEHLIGTTTLKPYMHGFFVDLRLYTKARAIANPFAYAEYRDRLARDKMEKERESRIRSSKQALSKKDRERQAELQKAIDDAKVNKGLAERIKEREDKEQRAKERRAAKRAAKFGRDEDIENEEEGIPSDEEQQQVQADEKPAATSVLTDDRFKTLFTDPEFQVDEDSLEFAMLNPSTAARNVNQRDRQRITASDLMGDIAEDSGEDASEPDDEDDDASDQDSNGSSDSGDLGQYDPRSGKAGRSAPGVLDPRTGKRKAPAQVQAKAERLQRQQQRKAETAHRPRLVVGEDIAPTVNAAGQTLGQRARSGMRSNGSSKVSRSGRSAMRGSVAGHNDAVMRSTPGGGMEMSFVPTSTSADDAKDEARLMKKQKMGKQAKDTLRAGRIGAGLEKDSGASESARVRLELSDQQRSGRTGRRREIRSASRNKTRHL